MLEQTAMPCGRGCGVSYVVHELALPRAVQAAAIEDGWRIVEDDDGRRVMACKACSDDWLKKNLAAS